MHSRTISLATMALGFALASAAPATESTSSDSLNHQLALDHYLTGSVHEEAGELLPALVQYQLANLYDPASPTILKALANAYIHAGFKDAGLKMLEEWRSEFGDDGEILVMLTAQYLVRGRAAEAASALDALAKLRPLEQDELRQYAGLLAATDRRDEALKEYEQYIERFGPSVDIYERIGLLYLSKKDIKSAEETFVKLSVLDSTDYRILFVLGGFAVAKEEWDVAEGYFRRALEGDSTNLRVWTNLLMVLNEQEKFQETLDNVNAALEIFDQSPQLLDIKGSVLERLGSRDEALEALQQAVELDSTRLGPYLTMGFIHHQKKEWELAALCYDKALEIAPDNPTVMNNYAYMLSEQNYRLEDALRLVSEALQLRPDNASFMDTRGWIYYRLGKYDSALKDIRKAHKLEPDNAELNYHLGMVYRALGKESKAADYLQKALRLDPDNPEYRNP